MLQRSTNADKLNQPGETHLQLLTFVRDGEPTVGIYHDGKVQALDEILPNAPASMREAISAGDDLLSSLKDADFHGTASLDDVELLPVVPDPEKFICLGLNYAEHAKEGGRDVPEHMSLFIRTRTSLAAHGQTVPHPVVSEEIDYEAELAVVIGKRIFRVSESEALDAVYGYAPFNDISVRDYQRRGTQWTAGKNFDATGPFGPVIITKDELPVGARGLAVRSILNGDIMQDGDTSDMIFDIARVIAGVSECMTLEPGDVIVTGTPAGVGFARNPPVFMKSGDKIEIEIEGFPRLVNTIG